MPSGASSHNGCCRTTLGCLGSQPAPISAPWKPGRYQIKKSSGPTYLWAWENKSTAHWCCGMQPMISYMCFPGFQGFFFIFPWEVIFPGLVVSNVHWPSHEKLSFCGFQGPFDAWTWENILLSPWYPDHHHHHHHHHWWIRKKNLQFLSQLTRVRSNWSPRSCPSAGRTSCGTSHST